MSSSPVFLITGCSSGLGYEMSRFALKRGFRVIATARRVETLASLKEQGAATLPLDVTASPTELGASARSAWAVYGQVDVLINNAGYLTGGALEEHTPDEIFAQLNTNVLGVLTLTNAFLPLMRARRTGTIVNISSVGSGVVFPGVGVYNMSKAAIDSVSDTWAAELKEFGIRCVSVQMGSFRTEVLKSTNVRRAARKIEGYTLAKSVAENLIAGGGKEPGDPAKCAQRVIDYVSQPGELPSARLAVGGDAYEKLRAALVAKIEEMDKVKEWSVGTNF
ncbi:Short-chain dehydrogenase/reductase family protein [Mycena kentingensis (nom. inval.)]|nr:Short-chain dehydrogenase/reductase family protein [Mycena kentingensis (nom. inval.)]